MLEGETERQFRSFSVALRPQRPYGLWTLRDGESRTSTSSSTQLLSSDGTLVHLLLLLLLVLYVHIERPYGLLGTGSPGRPLLSHSS